MSAAATERGAPPPGVRTVAGASPEPTRVVLIRHGEATCNVEGIVGGHRGCTGLSPTGQHQAQLLQTRLDKTGELGGAVALYSSMLARAIETARIVAPGIGDGTAAVADCDLCELHPGEADGLTWSEFGLRYGEPDFDTDPDTIVAPGGESWSSFVTRASNAVERLVQVHRGELVVLVCHAGVIESTMISFLEIPPALSRRGWTRIVHASLTEWEWIPTESRWVLVRFNDACGVPTA